ncbi:TDT family transporter [Nocardia sp. CDC159]|uniref:TDT family transporter n=1 Tax=Nocardia pulmonis TaxID=2951408 RepID=A0A9X2E1H3_9NOCA|nr:MULTISPECIES: TDT family transporter [Nocardia]MCM6772292.1 TDT family transporter [Nocardia pulmonis]MCM6785050.1 TDT family transporter [Nocardia sp. CDC159]
MTTLTDRPAAPATTRTPRGSRILGALDHPRDAFAHIGPNWFAVVMGTGIVANAAVTLPWQLPGQRAFATGMWMLAAGLLLAVGAAWVLHWRRFPAAARGHGAHPVMSQFYGAPPMALLTVGLGALLVGRDVVGLSAAVAMDWALWSAGTLLGLVGAVAIPYRMITRHRYAADAAFGGWLMPIVPPMVSAATGAMLIPHTPAGQPRSTLVLACLAMFGLSLIAAFLTLALIWSRLLHFGPPAAGAVATVWLVLGPLGQSITAAGLLASNAAQALPPLYASGLEVFAVVYGVAAWGFAMLWLALALALTYRARHTMPFNLTWWGLTFPLGTCVTGSTTLFTHTGAIAFALAATAMYTLLLALWALVAARTAAHTLDGTLLRPPTRP